jgi:hypothetical protein
MTQSITIKKYILLITEFVEGAISASQFEIAYLEMFKAETSHLSENVYGVLNNLFLDVDAYCEDPQLRDEEDLNDIQLLASAKTSLERLTD